MTTFGSRLKQLREDKSLTQEQLGKVLNVKKAAVSKYENENTSPDNATLCKLADFFSVTVDYLLGRTDDPSPRPKIETIAASRTDDPLSELPPEARKSVEEFIDYIMKKYKKED